MEKEKEITNQVTDESKGHRLAGRTFSSLKSKNYRLWFWGQMASLFGTWMQNTAQGYLINELTNSAAFLGYVGFAAGVPSWLLMLYGGVIADRMQRRNLMVITQSVMMILAFILAGLTFGKIIQPWHIIFLAFLLGVANAFDAPTRLSFVSELVDKENLANAIALNSTMFNTATTIGPAVAGLAYAFFGPGWSFTINGVSFIAIIIPLMMMRFPKFVPRERKTPVIVDLKEGFSYIVSQPAIISLLAILAAVSIFGISFIVLLPRWATNILHGNAVTFGLLQSFRGIGAFIAAIIMASLGHKRQKGKILSISVFSLTPLVIIFTFIRWTPGSLFLITLVGASFISIVNNINALIQCLAPEKLRGRVMSFYSLIFFGSMPIGALLVGTLAQAIGESLAIIICASAFGAIVLLVWFIVPKLRELE